MRNPSDTADAIVKIFFWSIKFVLPALAFLSVIGMEFVERPMAVALAVLLLLPFIWSVWRRHGRAPAHPCPEAAAEWQGMRSDPGWILRLVGACILLAFLMFGGGWAYMVSSALLDKPKIGIIMLVGSILWFTNDAAFLLFALICALSI